MKEVDLKAELKTLRQILQEMKALLAWQQLKHSEVRQISISGIRFFDTTNADMLDKYSSFLSISLQIHHILDEGKTKITKDEQSRVKSELVTMEYPKELEPIVFGTKGIRCSLRGINSKSFGKF